MTMHIMTKNGWTPVSSMNVITERSSLPSEGYLRNLTERTRIATPRMENTPNRSIVAARSLNVPELEVL